MHIVIVGGGLTGAVAAIHLLHGVPQRFTLTIVEPDQRIGAGLAYGRAEPFHLLNVRAGKLGLGRGSPADFSFWAKDQSIGTRIRQEAAEPARSFLPRRLFGSYVEERFRAAIASRPDILVAHRRGHATNIRRSGSQFTVAAEGGRPLTADVLILASGYGRPKGASDLGLNPYCRLDPDAVCRAGSALLIGTGLTAVDAFLRLAVSVSPVP